MIGDILFFKGTSFVGKIICFITGSPYCHCVLDIGDDLVAEYDGFYGKGKIKHIGESVDGYDADRYRLTSEYHHLLAGHEKELTAIAVNICNTRRYNLLLSMIAGIYHWLHGLVFLPEITWGTHCSGMVSEVYRKTILDLATDVPDAATTPGLLAKSPYLEKVGGGDNTVDTFPQK